MPTARNPKVTIPVTTGEIRGRGSQDLQRWLIEDGVQMSKVDGQLTKELFHIYNQKVVRMEEQETEGSDFNKQS